MFLVGTLSRCTSFSISCMSFPLSPHIEVSAAEGKLCWERCYKSLRFCVMDRLFGLMEVMCVVEC